MDIMAFLDEEIGEYVFKYTFLEEMEFYLIWYVLFEDLWSALVENISVLDRLSFWYINIIDNLIVDALIISK